MALSWITPSNLGSYSIDHDFAQTPIYIQFSADATAQVKLESGLLPLGLSWQSWTNTIRIIGEPAVIDPLTTYGFVFSVTNNDGSSISQQFTMQLLGSPTPAWITQGDLGSYANNYSFDLSPLVINYSADTAASVSLLNGSLPEGLVGKASSGAITISGVADVVAADTASAFTYRITNPNGTIADRSFTVKITKVNPVPDWSAQTTMLGYIGTGQQARFVVKAAVSDSTAIFYSLVGTIPPGLGIDSVTGTITYASPAVVSDTVYTFTVRASTVSTHSDLVCAITVITTPHDPVWITPLTEIIVAQGAYLEYYLNAYDPEGGPIQYNIVNSDPGFPFTLDSTGFLYGKAPKVSADTVWTVTISADTVHGTFIGSTLRVFTVKVTKINQAGVLVWRNASTEILNVSDGYVAVFDVGATSTRTPTVIHSIVGGQCPPGLVLDKTQGCLVGFIDYHTVDKDYWFNISATDQVDTVIRTIHMQVTAKYNCQFSSYSIPLMGDVKDSWITTVGYVLTNGSMIPNVNVLGNQLYYPSMSLIRGLDTTTTDPNSTLTDIAKYLQRTTLTIGSASNVRVDSQGDTLVYRNIVDPQAGIGLVEQHINGNPSQIYPMSLTNLRSELIASCGFANGGGGTNTTAIAIVNPEDGGITSVKILNPGSGYITAPSVRVVGTGTGAKLRADMIIQNMIIRDPGQGWRVGEHLVVNIGTHTRPAEFVVLAVNSAGGLESILIIDGGLYQQVPIGKIWITNSNGGISGVDPDLGLASITVLSGGQGYGQTGTSIEFTGNEILEPWQTEWSPIIPIAMSTPSYANTVINNSQLDVTKVLDGLQWQVGDLIWDVEGLYWQGTTNFDTDLTSFDGATTRFQETLTPQETIFDSNHMTTDYYLTTYDVGPMIASNSRLNWGQTFIDNSTTAFEFYATVFDIPRPPTRSITLVSKLVTLSMTQVSGQNITDNL